MSYYKKIISVLAFFVLCCSISAWAINLPYLDKAKIRLAIAPGETKYGEINLENPTNEPVSMKLYLEDWSYSADGSGSKEFAVANTTPLSCAPWITFSPAEINIPPFGKQRINYSVKVPAQAEGGHYATLFFETKLGEPNVSTAEMGAGISVALRIAALFYVEPEGTIKRSGEFKELSLKRNNATSPLSISVVFENTGNVDITCGGTYHLMDKEGVIYARGELSDAYTFGGQSAKMTAVWKEAIPKGKYDLVFTFDLGKALEEAEMDRGPVVVKEAEVEIGENGEVANVGQMQ